MSGSHTFTHFNTEKLYLRNLRMRHNSCWQYHSGYICFLRFLFNDRGFPSVIGILGMPVELVLVSEPVNARRDQHRSVCYAFSLCYSACFFSALPCASEVHQAERGLVPFDLLWGLWLDAVKKLRKTVDGLQISATGLEIVVVTAAASCQPCITLGRSYKQIRRCLVAK